MKVRIDKGTAFVYLKYLSMLLLVAGVLVFAYGAYGYFSKPVTLAKVRVDASFEYNASLLAHLTGSATDAFALKDVNAYIESVALYDASIAPQPGVVSSTLASNCSTGLTVVLRVDSRSYGPYCYSPSLLSSAGLFGNLTASWELYLSPGPHTIMLLASYNGQPVASRTVTLYVLTYEEAQKQEVNG